MKQKKLVIINQAQFGYHTSYFYFCKYLRQDFSIIYICWDFEFPRIDMPGVRVVYVSREGNVLTRSYRFLRYVFRELSIEPHIVLINYFKVLSTILKLSKPAQCFILDFRSGNVDRQLLRRIIGNAGKKLEARFFNHITVISEGLAEILHIADRAHILPVGGDIISDMDKDFDELNLIYVGTLCNRVIDNTINGFKKFFNEMKNQIPISYTIIGKGSHNEEEILRELATRHGLADVVTITGWIPPDMLKLFFDSANIGISYVPLTDYYDFQPPIKTFEYLLSGMPVIATHTTENRKIINPGNGVLVGDTAEEFYSGLVGIYENRRYFDSKKIRASSKDFSWENIVLKNLSPYIANLYQ